jgi:manganese/zinc/iron transport system ATP- binding protein
MTEKAFALEITNLTVNYERTSALWDISLRIPQGSLTAIIGPNGAGKSTLMKAILGLVKPTSGSFTILGEPLKKVRKRIAYVPQRESVDWNFPITVLDLVLMGCYGRLGFCRFPNKKDKLEALKALSEVGMDHLSERQINQLSGGQQQRAFIARSLFQKADLYFMDEPFAGIDIASAKVIVDLLIKLKKEGKTVLVVHHDLASVRHTYDYCILLNLHLIAAGRVEDVFTDESLQLTFGKDNILFDEAVKLDRQRRLGSFT